MPLTTCSECGASVSTSAKTCPGCGAGAKIMRPRQSAWPSTKLGWFALGMFGLSAMGAFMQLAVGTPASRPKTPEEIASDQRNRAAYNAVSAVIKSLRDPESATFEHVRVDDAATTVCIVYRARNGFGGMGLGHIAFIRGVPSEQTPDWKKHCAHQSMYELKGIARIAG